MHILGISAFYHDSAAALIRDGEIVAAAQEERFTRKKHDQAFPLNAITYCLREAGIEAEDVDYIGFYEKPMVKFERLLETLEQVLRPGWAVDFHRHLAAPERDAWKALLDHYAFEVDGDPAEHLAPHNPGILAPMTPQLAQHIDRWLAGFMGKPK